MEVHDLDRMEEILGSPDDDGLNAFTARMLLLLESRAVYGRQRHERFLERVVKFYYRDLTGHETDFVPIFLLNDILRFWRTLTLNYEHDRFEVARLPAADQPAARARSALKNYKLKVSRLATCFSMVIHLACQEAPVLPEDVLRLCERTPRQRFRALQGRNSEADPVLQQLDASYEAFLDRVQRDDERLLNDFRDSTTRQTLLVEAAEFGDMIFEVVRALVPADRLRHLVI